MAKRPKLRMTNADYVAIAVSPVLIMALVGSLVFFLIEVFYGGQYQGRLNYVFALFVFATVLIGRISIEMGADRAALFALPLGLAMLAVLAKFVPGIGALGWLMNVGLLALTWWSTHKLTWDCTLIDDNEDASGEGLMQRVGADELAQQDESASGNELLADEKSLKKKVRHTPGLWVLYFSLAALPLFGMGQKWIPTSDTGARKFAFSLLAVYVASGLALLVTTSFLGLRRYLRQRRVEMPAPMAVTWVVTGGVLIALVMILATLVPRPSAEYAISQLPWQVESPEDLKSSRNSLGDDGTRDEDAAEDARKVTGEETNPNAKATREGENPTTSSEEGEKTTSGGEEKGENKGDKGGQSQEGDEQKPEQGKQTESSEARGSESQADQGQSESQESTEENSEQSEGEEESDAEPKPIDPSQLEQESEQPEESTSERESSSPSRSLPDLIPSLGGLGAIFKLLMYAVFALVIGYLVWQNREAILQAVRELTQAIRDFLARFLGGKTKEETEADAEEEKQPVGPLLRPFASFADPFSDGQYQTMQPSALVQYTFEAFEAWSRERGYPRGLEQTPLELVRQSTPPQSELQEEGRRLAQLYNEAAYAPKVVSGAAVKELSKLWVLLRENSQTPVEPIS